MFRLEKIFQKDDNLYINISILLKSFLVFLSIYVFAILEFNSIYDLFNFDIYKKSKYFAISIYFPIFYDDFIFPQDLCILGHISSYTPDSITISLVDDDT